MKKIVYALACMMPSILWAQVNFIDNTTIHKEKVVVNSQTSDFGPAFVGNELWFSAFEKSDIDQLNQGKSNTLFYRLFKTPLNQDVSIKENKQVVLKDLSAGYHAGPVSYCEKTGELYVTLSNYENAEVENVVFQKKNIPLKIVKLTKRGNDWINAEELPFNSASYSVGHPAVSVTGDTLIFASDVSVSGMGKTDLYMAVRKNGKWEDMINLGAQINSNGNDMFPYLHKGKILFYASDGKAGGKGKFDIWYSVLSENGFSTPENYGKLNSPADDFGLIVHSNEETGYFVTNQDSNEGDDNIYKLNFEGEYKLDLMVSNRKTKNPVTNVPVEFSDKITLYTNFEGKVERELEKHSDYTAKTNLEGYMNQSVSFSTKNQLYGTIKKELVVEETEVGQKYVLKHIYYSFDKWNILSESEPELIKLAGILKDNPSWKVELGSHTDCRGTHEYNDLLSNRRSDSAVNYIKSKGVSMSRIIAKGYGEYQILNKCKDGIPCTEEEHRLNRRTEFTILEMK